MQGLCLSVGVQYLGAEDHAASGGLLLPARRVHPARPTAQGLAEPVLYIHVTFLAIGRLIQLHYIKLLLLRILNIKDNVM